MGFSTNTRKGGRKKRTQYRKKTTQNKTNPVKIVNTMNDIDNKKYRVFLAI
jgi:hypothetical protein